MHYHLVDMPYKYQWLHAFKQWMVSGLSGGYGSIINFIK